MGERAPQPALQGLADSAASEFTEDLTSSGMKRWLKELEQLAWEPSVDIGRGF